MPSITLTNLVKQYRGGTEPAVNQLNLTIEDGEFMCLLGPSGCGKTTTLRMIAGIEYASSGAIAIGDQAVDDIAAGVLVAPEQRNIGLVFQSYALWPHMTVAQNVAFGLKIQGLDKAERARRTQSVMETLRIENYADRYPSQLSGGQQQRVALARMLAVNPKVLLLDEPLSNLDASLRLEMRKELRRIHQTYGTTVVFVSHDQWEAMTLATRIAVMNEGKIQQVGSPDEIYSRPANRFVAEFIGNPNMNFIALSKTPQSALAAQLQCLAAATNQTATHCGIRPESLLVTDNPDMTDPRSGIRMPAIVESMIPTGGAWVVELMCGGETLIYATQHRPQWGVEAVEQVGEMQSTNQTVWCEFPAHALHFFDADGQRLPDLDSPTRALSVFGTSAEKTQSLSDAASTDDAIYVWHNGAQIRETAQSNDIVVQSSDTAMKRP